MSAIFGYNVYDLEACPHYPISCPDLEAVEDLVKGDYELYVVRVRRDPDDYDCLEDDCI